jgi:hypothetical protein
LGADFDATLDEAGFAAPAFAATWDLVALGLLACWAASAATAGDNAAQVSTHAAAINAQRPIEEFICAAKDHPTDLHLRKGAG